ncbi:MAG: NUDIX hydrolase [Caldilineales bacterium]|nr:NUDIX hydrolase [Caldilineales bacterium]
MRTPADRTLLADWLRAIPQSRHAPRPLEEMPGGQTIGQGLAAMLQVWGAVELSDAGIRAVSQPAYYFIHSLAAWAEAPGQVITDWSQVAGAEPGQGLRHGSSLVHLLENERLARNPDAPAIRHTAVAQILIVRPGNPVQFLGQWDMRAGYFQMIGGRQKVDLDWEEPIERTAIREVEEELHGQVSHDAGEFRLEKLANFAGDMHVSPSFGALTAYHFTFFRAFDLPPISLDDTDRWLTRDELADGQTHDGKPVRGDYLPRLESILGYPILELPSSFR